MAERTVRGSIVTGQLKYINKKWGQDGEKACRAAVGLAETKIKEGEWYEEHYSSDIIRWIDDEKGRDHIVECGRFTVQNLGLIAYVVRFMDITSILKRAVDSYRQGFGWGTVKARIGHGQAIMVMRDVAIDENTCLVWLGAFEGMLELTKTKGRVRETHCQMKGAPHCEFLIEWDR